MRCCCAVAVGGGTAASGDFFFLLPIGAGVGGAPPTWAMMVRVWHKKRVRGGGAPGVAHWCPLFWGMGVVGCSAQQNLGTTAKMGGAGRRQGKRYAPADAVPEAPASSN